MLQEINLNTSRIGFVEFSTKIKATSIQTWSESYITQFIQNMVYDSLYYILSFAE